jgi:hypothetical protein
MPHFFAGQVVEGAEEAHIAIPGSAGVSPAGIGGSRAIVLLN